MKDDDFLSVRKLAYCSKNSLLYCHYYWVLFASNFRKFCEETNKGLQFLQLTNNEKNIFPSLHVKIVHKMYCSYFYACSYLTISAYWLKTLKLNLLISWNSPLSLTFSNSSEYLLTVLALHVHINSYSLQWSSSLLLRCFKIIHF